MMVVVAVMLMVIIMVVSMRKDDEGDGGGDGVEDDFGGRDVIGDGHTEVTVVTMVTMDGIGMVKVMMAVVEVMVPPGMVVMDMLMWMVTVSRHV